MVGDVVAVVSNCGAMEAGVKDSRRCVVQTLEIGSIELNDNTQNECDLAVS